MRTSTFQFRGRDYLLCLSTRVLMEMEEEGLSIEQMLGGDGKRVTTTFKVLEKMIRAGDTYAKLEGIENPGTVTLDELIDRTSPEDYDAMFAAVAAAAKGERNVEAEPGKNAEATQTQTATP